MQDETIPNETTGQSTGGQSTAGQTTGAAESAPPVIAHLYYEVGSDVLSKPNALCDLLEVCGCPPSCIFCNAPSDADLVEVILKKRGISALKLIGHVPPMRAARALKQVKSGEIASLVVTDVSGQSIDVEELDLVVNYSLPTAPEVYIHRCGHSRAGAKLSKVVSLIGALDIANLHYLNKIVEFDIVKAELPASGDLLDAKLGNLRKQAIEMSSVKDDRLKELTAQVLKDEHKEEIVTLLLRNTLELLPSLQTASRQGEREEEFSSGGGGGDEEYGERRDDYGERRNDYGDRQRGQRGGGRGGRDRGGYGGRSGGGSGGGGRYGSGNSNDEFQQQQPEGGGDDYGQPGSRRPRHDRGDNEGYSGQRDEGGYSEGGGYSRHREQRPYIPPEKHARVYLGCGTTQGMSGEKLTEILAQQCNLGAGSVKGAQVRGNYSFFDIPEESAEDAVNLLNEVRHGQEKLFARKATTVSVPRPQSAQQADTGAEMPQSDQGEGGEQPESSEDDPMHEIV